MTESFELFCKENAFLIGMDVWQNINPHEYLTSSNDKDDYAIRVKDFETYLNKALEQSRLEGIEEGKKNALGILTKVVGKSIFQMTDEYREELRQEGRLKMLKEIEKLFVHLEGDDITGGGIDGEYLSKEVFESIEKEGS